MDRITVVTGAAGALGSGVSRDLARRGHRVIAAGLPAQLPSLNDLVREIGGVALAFDGSVEAWRDALADVETDVGPVTGAVFTAGGWRGGAPLWDLDQPGHYESMLQMNLDTVYQPLRALLARMVPRGLGSVVVVGSRAAVRPETSGGAAAYAAAKAAAVALVEVAAAEAKASGVRVNAVLPSTLDTPANRKAMPDADPSRWVPVASLAAVIAFLLSDDARDVSGAALPVYGRA